MRRPAIQVAWPESWQTSFSYDLQEVFGEVSHVGYAYVYQNRRDETIALVKDALPAGSRILDIAAAQGNFSIGLAESGYDVTWNDLRAELEGYVRLKHERGVVRYAPGNAFELAFAEPFDGVLITEVIEHVAHPDRFLANTARLVRPGGFVFMTTPNGGYFRNTLPRFSECPDPSAFEVVQFRPNADGHIFLLHVDEIRDMARRAGLVLEKLVLFNNPLTSGHVKTEALLQMLPGGVVRAIERTSRLLPVALRERMLVQTAVRFRRPIDTDNDR